MHAGTALEVGIAQQETQVAAGPEVVQADVPAHARHVVADDPRIGIVLPAAQHAPLHIAAEFSRIGQLIVSGGPALRLDITPRLVRVTPHQHAVPDQGAGGVLRGDIGDPRTLVQGADDAAMIRVIEVTEEAGGRFRQIDRRSEGDVGLLPRLVRLGLTRTQQSQAAPLGNPPVLVGQVLLGELRVRVGQELIEALRQVGDKAGIHLIEREHPQRGQGRHPRIVHLRAGDGAGLEGPVPQSGEQFEYVIVPRTRSQHPDVVQTVNTAHERHVAGEQGIVGESEQVFAGIETGIYELLGVVELTERPVTLAQQAAQLVGVPPGIQAVFIGIGCTLAGIQVQPERIVAMPVDALVAARGPGSRSDRQQQQAECAGPSFTGSAGTRPRTCTQAATYG